MMQEVKVSPGEKFVNPHLLLDALVHTKKGLSQFKGPDEFKTGGHLCFWISRIKPFRAFLQRNARFTNEAMALQIGLSIVRETKGRKAIPSDILSNLLYELRYGFVSPMGVSYQFQLLYC